MILYSIRRKSDGKFFSMWYGGYSDQGQWNNVPTFWKKSETIWAHLKKMCSALDAQKKEHHGSEPQFYHWWIERKWHSFDPKFLTLYEVIETNVSVLGEKRISAETFVNAEQMEVIRV